MAVLVDTLFYKMRADATELERGLQNAERQFGKLASFIISNPNIAVASFGTALLTVGYQATQMAAEVDRGFKDAIAAAPTLRTGLAGIKDEVRSLSLESGRAQRDLSASVKQIADGGVQSAKDVQVLLRAGVTAADASGDELADILSGLDAVSDQFGLSAEQSAQALADLFATAQGRSSLVDVLAVLEKAQPIAEKTGLSIQTIGGAIVTLNERGQTTKQIVAALKDLADQGAAGRKDIEGLAGAIITGEAAMQRLHAAAATSREEAAKLGDILRANLNAAMIDLGNTILPTAIAELKGLDGILNVINGTVLQIGRNSASATVASLAGQLDKLTGGTRQQAVTDLRESLYQLVTGEPIRGLQRFDKTFNDINAIARTLSATVKTIDTETLDRVYRALLAIVKDVRPDQVKALYQAIGTASVELAGRPDRGGVPGAPVSPRVAPLTDAEKNAIKQAEAAIRRLQDSTAVQLAAIVDRASADFLRLNQQLNNDLASIPPSLRTKYEAAAREARDAFFKEFTSKPLVSDPQVVLPPSTQQRVTEALTVTLGAPIAKAIVNSKDLLKVKGETLDATKAIGIAETEQAAAVEAHAREVGRRNQEELQYAYRRADALAAAVRATLDLAGAFGNVDENVRRSLEGILSVATSIGPLAKQFDSFKSGAKDAKGNPLVTATDLVGSALPIVTGIIGTVKDIFGDSPEEKAYKAGTLHALEQIEQHTREIGNLDADVSGNEFARIRSGLQAAVPEIDRLVKQAVENNDTGDLGRIVRRVLDSVGLSTDDLEKAVGVAGIDRGAVFGDGGRIQLGGLGTLLAGLQSLEITRFSTSFSGQVDALDALLRISGQSGDAGARLAGLQRILGSRDASGAEVGSSALAQQLDGLDLLGSADARSLARGRLTALVSGLNDGSLTESNLGALTGRQFLDTIQQIGDLLTQLDQQAVAAAEKAAADAKAAQEEQERIAKEADDERKRAAEQALQDDKDAAAARREASLTVLARAKERLTFDPSLDTFAVLRDALAGVVPGLRDTIGVLTKDAAPDAIRALYTALRDGLVPAAELGDLSVDDVVDALDGLLSAATKTADAVVAATRTLGDALRDLSDTFTVNDISDPVEQLKELAATITDFSPAVAAALQGLDLATDAGRAAAEKALAGLFGAIVTGDAAALGGEDAETLRQAILAFKRASDSADDAAARARDDVAQAGGTPVTPEVGTLSGMRYSDGVSIVGLLQTSNALLAEIVGNTAGLSLAPLAPPRLSPGFATPSAGPGATVLNVTVNNYITVEGNGDPTAIAAVVRAQTVEAIDRALAQARSLSVYLQQGPVNKPVLG